VNSVEEHEGDRLETNDIIAAMRSWLETVALVPVAYEQYAPLVTDGLLFFLGRLPPSRLEAIVADQMLLAADASADERLIGLVRQCPTLHKLGQVIARQSGLPLDLRARLQGLESLAPPPGGYDIESLIAREIGSVPGLTVSADTLAEGSVAFVVPFEWQPGPGKPIRRGVFKALKPNAEQQLLEDLAVWPELGDYLEERSVDLGLATLDFRSLLDGVAGLLRNEIRLDGEQDRLERARSFYSDSPNVVIPELFPFCTPRLTAMQRIDGTKVTDASVTPAMRRHLAQTIVAALLAKPFWTAATAKPFFHADPHAGNLFAMPDGKLAIFDWALTTELTNTQLAAVVRTLLCAAALDEPGVIGALGLLGVVKREADLQAAVSGALGEVRRGTFPGFAWLTPLLDELGRTGTVAFPEETSLFRKSLLTLTGVIRDVWPNASVDEVLVASGGRQFIAESWLRPLVPLESRVYGTHLSSEDLLRFVSTLAWTPARYLVGSYRDAVRSTAARS
jgi:ubiquinone biosynthesis protein